jgi:hypothetical protein
MRKTCSSGSVEGVMANHDPYSDERSRTGQPRLGQQVGSKPKRIIGRLTMPFSRYFVHCADLIRAAKY